MTFFVEGLLLGLAYAMPLGPQNIFVINSAVQEGIPKSYRTFFIVSMFDVTLAIACLLGLGYLIDQLPVIKYFLLTGGGAFLVYLGIKLATDKNTPQKILDSTKTFSFFNVLKYCFILTWFNPQAIIDGSLMFGGIRASMPADGLNLFIFGLVVGSPLWFFAITSLAGSVRSKITPKVFMIINKTCGIFLTLYGAKLIYELIKLLGEL